MPASGSHLLQDPTPCTRPPPAWALAHPPSPFVATGDVDSAFPSRPLHSLARAAVPWWRARWVALRKRAMISSRGASGLAACGQWSRRHLLAEGQASSRGEGWRGARGMHNVVARRRASRGEPARDWPTGMRGVVFVMLVCPPASQHLCTLCATHAGSGVWRACTLQAWSISPLAGLCMVGAPALP